MRWELLFVCLAHCSGLLASLRKVLLNFLAMTEVVANHRIQIGKRDRRILLSDFFCCRTIQECTDDHIQGDTCAAQAQDTVNIVCQGNSLDESLLW